MRRLVAFNNVSLDGYFTDAGGDMSWAHTGSEDPEYAAFVAGNAQGDGMLVMGRVTYDLMAGYWPTPMAKQNDPVVAEGMNRMPKLVFSRTMNEAAWSNTTLVKGDPAGAIRKAKQEEGPDMAILGSGSIVSQLAQAGLIDEFQLVVNPVVLGKGRTMFDGVGERLTLRLTQSRAFPNGKMVLWYAP